LYFHPEDIVPKEPHVNGKKVAAIILSGGASRRMGIPKALLKWEDKTFLHWNVLALNRCEPVVVVTGTDHERIVDEADLPRLVVFARNPDPDRGQFSSLLVGCDRLPDETDATLVSLIDQPLMQTSIVDDMMAFVRCRMDMDICIPRHNGRPGHPVYLTRLVIGCLKSLAPSMAMDDAIQKAIGDGGAVCEYYDSNDSAILRNLNTREDYERLIHGLSPTTVS
jgi:CTP:molybdopterin cytidylyltransferase MocA